MLFQSTAKILFPPERPCRCSRFAGALRYPRLTFFGYDVTKDGKRFVVNRYVKPEHVVPLTLVLHADAEQQN
jgi:hypothetical protein